MVTLTHFPFFSHLRAEPNQHILHYSGGELVRHGTGLACWFSRLSASIALVPADDIETTFLLTEISADFQELSVQCTVRYRCAQPEVVASRLNCSLRLATGLWTESPLEKLANFWAMRAQQPARAHINAMRVEDALRAGAEGVRAEIETALKADAAIGAMGLLLVMVQVNRIAPAPEVEKALAVPTRESIQQKADEAMFARRALAVEKERAIKENELNTEIELAKKQEILIEQQGANDVLRVRKAAAAEREKLEAEIEREQRGAEGHARSVQVRAEGDAAAKGVLHEVDLVAEQRRVGMYKDAPPAIAYALAIQELAGKIQTIQHLNVTPDLLGSSFESFLRKQSE
jgi:regulator of protease activity HflC (stomatin/prohibitin superfamily)